jgi:general stress protein YciG
VAQEYAQMTKQTQTSEGGGPDRRGFAAMDQARQREIARKGGEAVSRDRQHMAEIGGKGGEVVSQDRQHMSDIGRKGGAASGERRSGRSE